MTLTAQNLKPFFNLGILDPNETDLAKRWDRVFDFILLIVMFWLPMQWYMQNTGRLTLAQTNIANWVIWGIFFAEALLMTILVKRKFYYLATNWLNLFIIVAVYPPFWSHNSTYIALLRYLRFIILLRLILPQLFYFQRLLTRNRFGITLLVFLSVTVLSGILETYIDPTIGSLWKGIWWAWQTVTTVGYGDTVPHTVTGQVFAAILMLFGVGLFSLVSANLAAYFIERGQAQKKKKPERQVAKQLAELEQRLNEIQEHHKKLHEKIDRLLDDK